MKNEITGQIEYSTAGILCTSSFKGVLTENEFVATWFQSTTQMELKLTSSDGINYSGSYSSMTRIPVCNTGSINLVRNDNLVLNGTHTPISARNAFSITFTIASMEEEA